VKNNLTSSFEINDVIKRTHNSKSNESITNNPLHNSIPLYQSNSASALNENSIPYERFNSNGNSTSFEPQLINDDQDDSSSSDSSRCSTPESEHLKLPRLISLDNNDDGDDPLLPSPIVLNVINTSVVTPTPRLIPQVDSKIKQLQSTLQHKVQIFDGKRMDPRDDCGPQMEIKKLVQQFDPLDESNKFEKNSDDLFSTSPNIADRHPSLRESIATNRVSTILQNIQSNYGTTSRFVLRPNYSTPDQSQPNNLIHFSPSTPTTSVGLIPQKCTIIPDDTSSSFDPLAPKNDKLFFPDNRSKSTETNGSNLIDF
jgi:hypothetical protein